MACHDKESLRTQLSSNEDIQKAKGLDSNLKGQSGISTDPEEPLQVDERWD